MNQKTKYRKSRKSKRITKMKNEQFSVNKAIGSGRAKFCKKMVHRKNRHVADLVYISTKDTFALKRILWDIS